MKWIKTSGNVLINADWITKIHLDNLPTGVKIFCSVFEGEKGTETYLAGWYETLEEAEKNFKRIERWIRFDGSIFDPVKASGPKVVLDQGEEGKEG